MSYYDRTGICTNGTAPSVSSINRILRNRAAERAAAEFARAAGYGLYSAAAAAAYPFPWGTPLWHGLTSAPAANSHSPLPSHINAAPHLPPGLVPHSVGSSAVAVAAVAAASAAAAAAAAAAATANNNNRSSSPQRTGQHPNSYLTTTAALNRPTISSPSSGESLQSVCSPGASRGRPVSQGKHN